MSIKTLSNSNFNYSCHTRYGILKKQVNTSSIIWYLSHVELMRRETMTKVTLEKESNRGFAQSFQGLVHYNHGRKQTCVGLEQ